MSIKTIITVDACHSCPFYERTVASIAADFLGKRTVRTGTCKHGGLGSAFPYGRTHIPDENVIPVNCPLHGNPATVELKR